MDVVDRYVKKAQCFTKNVWKLISLMDDIHYFPEKAPKGFK